MNEGAQKVEVQSVKEEKDLGVVFTDDLKPHTQCALAASARRIIEMVHRNFRRLDCEDLLVIYKMYIRPHVEFCMVPTPSQRHTVPRKDSESSNQTCSRTETSQL